MSYQAHFFNFALTKLFNAVDVLSHFRVFTTYKIMLLSSNRKKSLYLVCSGLSFHGLLFQSAMRDAFQLKCIYLY